VSPEAGTARLPSNQVQAEENSEQAIIAMTVIASVRGSLPKNISMKMKTFSIAAAVYSK
jgi:hypothetical protein